jgi:hypothetical protein
MVKNNSYTNILIVGMMVQEEVLTMSMKTITKGRMVMMKTLIMKLPHRQMEVEEGLLLSRNKIIK